MVAWSAGTPFTSYAHRRAALMALSTASAPVFMGITRSSPTSPDSSSQKGPSWSLWKARLVSVRRPSCACAAATRRGWRWPKFSAEYADSRSR